MSIYLGDTPLADGASTALLAGKADVDLSNVNVSGTSLASGWAMPSSRYINLTLGASGSTYTAPANGWFAISKATSSTNQHGTFINETNGICVTSQIAISGYYVRIFLPAKEGDVIKVSYSMGGTTQWFRFIYAEGEPNV